METIQDVSARIYRFGNKQADGNATMKNLLGGKGANLAEMSSLGIPVPPGFTITTEVCTEYNQLGEETVKGFLWEELKKSVVSAGIDYEITNDIQKSLCHSFFAVCGGLYTKLPFPHNECCVSTNPAAINTR